MTAHQIGAWLKASLERCLQGGKRRFALVPANEYASTISALIKQLDTSGTAECRVWRYDVADARLPAQFAPSSDSTEILEWSPEVLVICDDEQKIRLLSALNRAPWVMFPTVLTFGSGHSQLSQREAERLEAKAGEQSHAVGDHFAKANIWELLRHYSRMGKTGAIVELGVFRGGTLLMIAEMLRALAATDYRLVGFDTWDGFPNARCLLDMYADEAFVYRDFQEVSTRLKANGIRVVRGDIVDTIATFPPESLLLTFIDTDNYTPVKHALPLIAQRTVVGGAIIFDHYFALEEFNDALGDGIAAAEYFASNSEYLNLSGTGVFLRMP